MHACSPDPVVHQALRLVLHARGKGGMFKAACIPVLVFACLLVAVAAVSCVLATRALRRAAAREAVLNADLVRQKEALRQAERKSMNKSNAFVSASHDIRSALAAIAALVEMSRPRRMRSRPSWRTSNRWASAPTSSSVSLSGVNLHIRCFLMLKSNRVHMLTLAKL